jgi:hypothetical protein
MRSILRGLRDGYGAHLTHLLAMLGCLALTGYVLVLLWPDPTLSTIALWFIAAVVGHDLVLFPIYSLADRVVGASLPSARVPITNHIRIPALASGLLLLLFLPGIIRLGHASYFAATGQTHEPFLGRWLILMAAFFALSLIIYVIRSVRAHWPHGGTSMSPRR